MEDSFSHLHWDHAGDATPFTSADIVLGAPAAVALAEEAYPNNRTGSITSFPEDRKMIYVDYTPSSSQPVVAPFGPFARALDFYGDGSFYLVDTPGHFPGHLSGVVRVAPNTFAFLAGDLCHNRECYIPGKRLASRNNYRDINTARETIQKLATLDREYEDVVVILAHEPERLEEGLPLFPDDMREWAVKLVETRRAGKQLAG